MPALTVGHPEAGEFAPFYAGYVQLVPEEPVAALEAQARKTQALLAGVSDTLDTARLPEGLLLVPRQPVRALTKVRVRIKRKPELQRCMNPPRARLPGASVLML